MRYTYVCTYIFETYLYLYSYFFSFPLSKYIVLEVEAFERLLGPCMDLMKRNIDDYETQLIKIFGSKNNITDTR